VEKWEGLAVVPLRDTNAPNDDLLMVGCDNDFGATNVYHNGVLVGTNAEVVDHMLLIYRVTLPTYGIEPVLSIQTSNSDVLVEWPHAYSDLLLQASTSLIAPAWMATASNTASYRVPATNAAQFFRLTAP